MNDEYWSYVNTEALVWQSGHYLNAWEGIRLGFMITNRIAMIPAWIFVNVQGSNKVEVFVHWFGVTLI